MATPGHTSNHLCFAYASALFSGDHVMGWSTTVVVPPDGDMAAYMASLDKLRQRDDRIYYPAHGPAVTNPQQYVRHLVGHRMQREKQILRLVGEKARPIADIVANAYPGLDPRLVSRRAGRCSRILWTLNAAGSLSDGGDAMDSRLNKPLVLAMVAVALVLGVLSWHQSRASPTASVGGPQPEDDRQPSLESMRAQNRLDGLRRPVRVGGHQRTGTTWRVRQLRSGR